MWLMKTLLTSGCTNQRGAGQGLSTLNVRKLVIRNKERLMQQLSRFGINESTVYPGIEKAATEIAKLYDGRS